MVRFYRSVEVKLLNTISMPAGTYQKVLSDNIKALYWSRNVPGGDYEVLIPDANFKAGMYDHLTAYDSSTRKVTITDAWGYTGTMYEFGIE